MSFLRTLSSELFFFRTSLVLVMSTVKNKSWHSLFLTISTSSFDLRVTFGTFWRRITSVCDKYYPSFFWITHHDPFDFDRCQWLGRTISVKAFIRISLRTIESELARRYQDSYREWSEWWSTNWHYNILRIRIEVVLYSDSYSILRCEMTTETLFGQTRQSHDLIFESYLSFDFEVRSSVNILILIRECRSILSMGKWSSSESYQLCDD